MLTSVVSSSEIDICFIFYFVPLSMSQFFWSIYTTASKGKGQEK